jgi:nitrate reductase cytochrome c-type subunit
MGLYPRKEQRLWRAKRVMAINNSGGGCEREGEKEELPFHPKAKWQHAALTTRFENLPHLYPHQIRRVVLERKESNALL